MPDLATHALAGHLLYRASGGRLDLTLVLAGSMLPDVAAWLPMKVVPRLLPLGIPLGAQRFFPPMHSPVLVVAWCAFLAMLFVAAHRRLALRSLLAGSLAHVGLDLLQDKFDGGYLLLYPFSMRPFQVGLVPQDDWLHWLAGAAAGSAAVELWARRRRP